MIARIFAAACLLGLAGLAFAASPLQAETPAQLDRLASATAQAGPGIALARRQISAGDLLEALATLERVILNHPENDEARLFHAGVLCRLDDRHGALVELDALRGLDFPDGLWAEATAACRQGG